MVGHYALTASEREELANKERARLRRLRLLQVRQQAKEHAKSVREAVKKEKLIQVVPVLRCGYASPYVGVRPSVSIREGMEMACVMCVLLLV